MTVGSVDSARFVLDVQGLDGLKRLAHQDPQAQLATAARQFEALLLGQMLKSMREAGFDSGLIDSKRIRFYQSLCDQQLSQSLASKGIGLADMLIRQLSTEPHASAGAGALSPTAITRGTPRSLQGVPPVAEARSRFVDAEPFNPLATATARPSSSPAATAGTGETDTGETGSDDVFVQRFSAAARIAAQHSGLPAPLILAQAALESGWGRHEIVAGGVNSHNLFGIKAGAGWQGPVVHVATHEYVDGRRVGVREPFRAYRSYAEAFADHARLIGNNPRYAAVREAATPAQAAQALQRCGYATDPRYADKLIAIMQQLDLPSG